MNDAKKCGAADPVTINSELFVRQFEDIISAIHNKQQPTVSGDEAYKALKLILAIYESSASGQTVDL